MTKKKKFFIIVKNKFIGLIDTTWFCLI